MIVFRPIQPGAFQYRAFEVAMIAGQKRWVKTVLKEYKQTVEHWKHQVEFKVWLTVTKGGTLLFKESEAGVGTTDKIYGYVDEGTGQAAGHGGLYPITPKKPGGVLAFPSKSTPKTRQGSLKSGRGSRGKVDVVVQKVMHPGIKPRDFTGQIIKKTERELLETMQSAMYGAARKSGHGI